jgi:hypothetical protein
MYPDPLQQKHSEILRLEDEVWTCPLGVEGWDQNVMRL